MVAEVLAGDGTSVSTVTDTAGVAKKIVSKRHENSVQALMRGETEHWLTRGQLPTYAGLCRKSAIAIAGDVHVLCMASSALCRAATTRAKTALAKAVGCS